MSQIIPEGVKSNGHVPVFFIPDGVVTDLSAATAAQVTGVGVVQLDSYLVEGNPTINKATSTREVRRMCLKQAATKPGSETYTIDLTGVYDAQNATPSENQFYASLKQGVKGVLAIAWGYDSEEDLKAGVVLDLIRGEVGTVAKNSPVWDEDLTVTIQWLGEAWEEDVAVAA